MGKPPKMGSAGAPPPGVWLPVGLCRPLGDLDLAGVCASLLYCFQDIARYWPKLRIFLNPRLFNHPRWGDSSWKGVTAIDEKEWCLYLADEKPATFSRLATMQECDRQTDRRTDRHRPTASTALESMLSRARWKWTCEYFVLSRRIVEGL